jgi:uncharacterized membrane protein YbaN (DUF454 family)
MIVSGPEKLFYLTLGVMFLALGVVGLLIPIIPGVLFLAGAVYMLGRGSSRIRAFADSHPQLKKLQDTMGQMDAISALDRVRVACLMTLQGTVIGIQKLTVGLKRLIA